MLAVLLDNIGVVWVDDESVELSGLGDTSGRWAVQVLLLVFTSLWVLVVDDEVNLVGMAALVWTKHDNIRRGIGEFLLVKSLVIPEELQIRTTTLKPIWRKSAKSFKLEAVATYFGA